MRGAPLDAGTTLAQFVKCSVLNKKRACKCTTKWQAKIMHLNKLKVGKPAKTFAYIFEWVFEAAGFSAGGSFLYGTANPWGKTPSEKNHRNWGNLDEEKHEYKQ